MRFFWKKGAMRLPSLIKVLLFKANFFSLIVNVRHATPMRVCAFTEKAGFYFNMRGGAT